MTSSTLIVPLLIFISLLCLAIGVLVIRWLRPAQTNAKSSEYPQANFLDSQPSDSTFRKLKPGGNTLSAAESINPYQPLTTPTADTFATNESTRQVNTKRVAKYHKSLMNYFFAQLVCVLWFVLLPGKALALVVLLGSELGRFISLILLTRALFPKRMATILLVLTTITVLVSPCQLIIMFLVDRKARKTLKEQGYILGLLGAIESAQEPDPSEQGPEREKSEDLTEYKQDSERVDTIS
jgi:hypothetical protein